MARHSSCPQWANPASYSRNWKDQILAKAEAGEFDPQRKAERSSLLKLASTALDLHVSAVARGVCPRDDDGGSQPLAAALAALKTAATNR
jgi:hypothetical protein